MALRRFTNMFRFNEQAFVQRTIVGTCGGCLSGAAIAIKDCCDADYHDNILAEVGGNMLLISLGGFTGFMVMALHPLPLIGVSCAAIRTCYSKFKDEDQDD